MPTPMPTPARDTAKLSMVVTHPSGGDTRYVSVRITDEASNMILADMELSTDQFADLLSTRTVQADARVPGVAYRHRLFRERVFESCAVPAELGGKWDYARDLDGARARIDAWVEQARTDGGWERAALQLGSRKFYAIFERWEALGSTEPAGLHATVREYLDEHDSPAPDYRYRKVLRDRLRNLVGEG